MGGDIDHEMLIEGCHPVRMDLLALSILDQGSASPWIYGAGSESIWDLGSGIPLLGWGFKDVEPVNIYYTNLLMR